MQHHFFGHVMPLMVASVSHDANGVTDDINAFLGSSVMFIVSNTIKLM